MAWGVFFFFWSIISFHKEFISYCCVLRFCYIYTQNHVYKTMITYLYRVVQLKSFYFIYRIVCSCYITHNPNNALYIQPQKSNINGENTQQWRKWAYINIRWFRKWNRLITFRTIYLSIMAWKMLISFSIFFL